MSRLISLILLVGVGYLVASWHLLMPSHERDWAGGYRELPLVRETENGYRIEKLRNWSYDENGVTTQEQWIDIDIDPDTLERVWFVVEPFSNFEGVAHTMLSFEFADGDAYVYSVEARREVGESYQPFIAAVYPSFEYLGVWATERDMFVNSYFVADDDIYMYPLELATSSRRALLESVLAASQRLEAEPRWYNTLMANCTNVLARGVNQNNPGSLPLHYSWYLPGYAEEYLYGLGYISNEVSFEERKTAAYATERIIAAIDAPTPRDFSLSIRATSTEELP